MTLIRRILRSILFVHNSAICQYYFEKSAANNFHLYVQQQVTKEQTIYAQMQNMHTQNQTENNYTIDLCFPSRLAHCAASFGCQK